MYFLDASIYSAGTPPITSPDRSNFGTRNKINDPVFPSFSSSASSYFSHDLSNDPHDTPSRPHLLRQPHFQRQPKSSFDPFSTQDDKSQKVFDPVIGSPPSVISKLSYIVPESSTINSGQQNPTSLLSETRVKYQTTDEIEIATRYVIVGNVPASSTRDDLERTFAVS